MKSTEEILNEIKGTTDYSPVESRLNTDLTTFMKSELEDINLKKMFIAIDIDPTNGYKYIRGTRSMTRDVLLKILIFRQYSFEQIQSILKNYGFAILYSKNERDAAIIYCLHHQYSYIEIKRYLQQYNLLGL